MYSLNREHTITYHIEKVFKGSKLFNSRSTYFDEMLNCIHKRETDEFPRLEYNMDYFSFNNGILNIKTMEFINYSEYPEDLDIIARKRLNFTLNLDNLDTTKFN